MAQFIIIFNEEYFTEEDYYTLYWHSMIVAGIVAHILVMFFDERGSLKELSRYSYRVLHETVFLSNGTFELKSLSGIGIVSVGTPRLLLALLNIFKSSLIRC